MNLNKEQKEIINFGDGPFLIVAGAGTGKTTVITKRIAYLIKEKKVKPEKILALTFTDKAAGEMEERIDRLLEIGYADLWVSTFHSFCEKVLREQGLDIGLSTDFKLVDQTSAWMLLRKNLEKFNLNYYKPIGNPTKFLHSLLSHFSKCKDQGIYPEDYLEYADTLKTNLTDLPEGNEEERIKEIASAYHIYQKLLLDNNLLDFGDLINFCVKLFEKRPHILETYRKRFKYILVDEFQDTNWAQYNLVKMLAFPANNLTVCADDDQCLTGDAIIETYGGKKKIKEIKTGDQILTGVGKGHIGVSKVSKIFKHKKKTKLLTLKTKSGFKITVTDNHKMFCFVPYTKGKNLHYVYLMNRNNSEWRIGVTNDLIGRLRLERSADKILAIMAFQTDAEARYYETLWSLQYGIPTNCFMPRKGLVIKNNILKKLYKDIDVEKNIQKLATDLNIDLDSHHFCLDAVNRGSMVRIKIIIKICYRRYRSKDHVKKGKSILLNPQIRHSLSIETSNLETIQKLNKMGVILRKARRHGMRLMVETTDLLELGILAEKIQKKIGGIIEVRSALAVKYPKEGRHRPRTSNAVVMPAKNLVLGHCLPIKKTEKEIIYDEIVDIQEQKKTTNVYDLEIEKTHNFIANGIVVHNSIYRWRGASYANIIQFKKDFPKLKEIFLVQNYRSSQNILDLSYSFIKQNDPNRLEFVSKIDKKLRSQKKERGIVEHLHFKSLNDETQGVANKIIELLKTDKDASFSDFAVLVRANNSANAFCRTFERAGIPYHFLASRGLYTTSIVLDIVAYFKLLDNYHESIALYRVLNLPFLNISNESIMKINQYAKRKGKSVFEALKEFQMIYGIDNTSAKGIALILSQIEKHSALAKTKNVSEVLLRFMEDSGYLKFILREEDRDKLSNLTQFYKKIKDFEEATIDPLLKSFIEQMNLELESGEQGKLEFDLDKGPDFVKVMTIHGSKGLEFKYVFMVNMVDKRFPTTQRKEPIEIPDKLAKEKAPEGDIHIEEERRLCYVAMTRAKKGLFFSSANDYGGERKKKLSRFLQEMNFKETIGNAIKGKKLDIKTKKELSFVLPPYFSFSQIASFSKCPLQYKYAYILRVPTEGKAIFSFGQTIHSTLCEFVARTQNQKTKQENLFNGKAEKKQISLDELNEIFEKKWINEWYADENQQKEYKKLGKKIIASFYKDFFRQTPKILEIDGELALELPFKLKIGDYTILGRIDRIDRVGEGVKIIDYKTGKAKEKLLPSDKQQLLMYQMATKDVFGLNPVELSYYYLEKGKMVSFIGSQEDMAKQKQDILKKIDEMKKSDFSATPGFYCQFCDFRNICDHANR